MGKTIKKLTSRYKDVETTAEQIDDNRVILKSNGQYHRCILDREDDTKIVGIDFEGGPMINLYDKLFGKKVKSFKACFIVELE